MPFDKQMLGFDLLAKDDITRYRLSWLDPENTFQTRLESPLATVGWSVSMDTAGTNSTWNLRPSYTVDIFIERHA